MVSYSLHHRLRIVAADTNGPKAHSLSQKSVVETGEEKGSIQPLQPMKNTDIVQTSQGIDVDDHRNLVERAIDGGVYLWKRTIQLIKVIATFVSGLFSWSGRH